MVCIIKCVEKSRRCSELRRLSICTLCFLFEILPLLCELSSFERFILIGLVANFEFFSSC
jgi:hypothetical protein